MELPAINPVSNPAEDNWMSRAIAKEILGDEERYFELTQHDFNRIFHLKGFYFQEENFYIPKQIGNVVHLEYLNINSEYLIY